jgi:uncharacterized membrane protein YheB (UPF0754 family)
MIEIYNELFKEYQKYIENNNRYDTRVVKTYTSTSTKFPIISCQLSNFIDTDYCTIDMVEKHDEMYLTIDIYTENKNIDNTTIASQQINDELTDLTIKFFESKRMRRTLCRLTPNADKNIARRTIQYQGLVSRYRKNIIRR